MVAVAVLVTGLVAVTSLLSAGSQPVLPSGHVVLVSLQPSSHHVASGGGHLIWYRTGQLLVVDVQVQDLEPGATVSALLVHRGTCSGPLPSASRLLGKVNVNSRGVAAFNDELLGVSNLQFSDWSIWIGVSRDRSPSACGVVTLANGALTTS
ncbi:MAG: hypothetical protein WAO09_10820 [Candidatus Dormiibacterota bacterium]